MNCKCINFPMKTYDNIIEVHKAEVFYVSLASSEIYLDHERRSSITPSTLTLVCSDTFSSRKLMS